MNETNDKPIAASDVALILAGKEAGAFDPYDMPVLVTRSEGTAADRVAALKTAKPHLFQQPPKTPADPLPNTRKLPAAEYQAAKRDYLSQAATDQKKADADRHLSRTLSKYQTTEDS